MRGLLVPVQPADRVERPRLVDVAHDWQQIAQMLEARYVEHVRTPIEGVALLVDEEGGVAGRPVNWLVTHRLYPWLIYGPVLVVSETRDPADNALDVTSLHPTHLSLVRAALPVQDAEAGRP